MSTVRWAAWEPFQFAVGQPLDRVERPVARRYFQLLLSARQDRKRQLEELLARNGTVIGTDDDGLQRLDDWYRAHVEADADDAKRLSARWHAVGLDIGLYLGDAIIERAPAVEWRLFTGGRKDASFQRPVLMGFSSVQNPRYNVDPERLVAIHGHRLIAGLEEPSDYFVLVVCHAALKG